MSQNFDDIPNENDSLINIDNIDDETLDVSLRAALHRQDCPETMILGEYQLDLLAKSEATDIADHVKRCLYCQAELDRLSEFLSQDVPVDFPTPLEVDSPWQLGQGFKWQHWKEAGQVIIQLVDETLDTFTRTLKQGLQPPTGQLAYGGSRSGKPDGYLFQLTLKEGVEDLEVTITAETKHNNPQQCTVMVEVDIPSRGGWPNLAGTEVTLKQNELTLHAQTTDAFGRTVFQEINIDEQTQLTFKITPSQPDL